MSEEEKKNRKSKKAAVKAKLEALEAEILELKKSKDALINSLTASEQASQVFIRELKEHWRSQIRLKWSWIFPTIKKL